ncbi:alpha/beta hydrolase [Deinococcus yavapaiensis]|uniref:Alpha/beta hydrolase family protein n=1 Tax=Deinococcus yavapaiensis KR-236 TaxID=694435 RepID=A0A318S717_9DEIO|nr:alpha/beta hydrolase [Deinococcus yavapaiensis]PYE53565.1 hypothetical protein DES52_10894 [Deinococcus yavapaiensis KR-236]
MKHALLAVIFCFSFGAAALDARPPLRVERTGAVAPGTPARYNASITLRYGNLTRPDRVLILAPGFLGGAGSLDRVARQLVDLDPDLAVWTVDRRSNLLEPQDRLRAASDAELHRIARDGLRALAPENVAFMKEWGLDVTLRDMRAAVLEARTLTPNVLLGGHSLGATLATLYAAYDFDGAPGWKDLTGLVLLDGTLGMNALPKLSAEQYQSGFTWNFLPVPGVRDLGRMPYVNYPNVFGPDRASRAAALARIAAKDPNGTCDANITRFPVTNLAAAMLQVEGIYSPMPMLAVTTGRATNVRESYNWAAVLLNGAAGFAARDPFNVRDSSKPVGWQQDERAPTNALDFVNRYWTPESDFAEWYFPTRLALDIAAAGFDTRGTPFEKTLRVWHAKGVRLPVLGVSAQNGLTTAASYEALRANLGSPVTVRALPGYAHLDVVTATSNEVARTIVGWAEPTTATASGE